MEYVALGCRSLVALLFLVSAASKLRGRSAYADFLAATRRLAPPWPPVRVAAAAVVAAELAIVVLVAVPGTVRAGFALALGLLAAFTCAIAAALRRAERTPCACFGASDRPLGRGHLARNLILMAVSALGLLTYAPVTGDVAAMLTAVAAGAVAAIVVALGDDLIDLFSPTA
ncbi:MauE/DoxX family redox-associated membrane protein [Nonomuraea turcica]|uniref:MauE/DoxX family redox-associated membrane protein n=1 Tax=Nonomuraea sp. G32 TaxID=3067274 RepID=UPI00273BBC1B|nr:MauE/DoxX family redox-associated membrane protein [Nonomuraea sp. G32]MDP4510771.1 hypothetical protein [Nonomuraea sp. G32]